MLSRSVGVAEVNSLLQAVIWQKTNSTIVPHFCSSPTDRIVGPLMAASVSKTCVLSYTSHAMPSPQAAKKAFTGAKIPGYTLLGMAYKTTLQKVM